MALTNNSSSILSSSFLSHGDFVAEKMDVQVVWRKLQKWDSKQCPSQICHSKHHHRKNGTPNVNHLIILQFRVFPLFFFLFKYLAGCNDLLTPLYLHGIGSGRHRAAVAARPACTPAASCTSLPGRLCDQAWRVGSDLSACQGRQRAASQPAPTATDTTHLLTHRSMRSLAKSKMSVDD